MSAETTSLTPAESVVMQRVDTMMRARYGIGLDAMEIGITPGYWQDKEPIVHRGHPLYSILGCSGPFQATYTYFDPDSKSGQFVSPTMSWRTIRDFASVEAV